MRSRAALLASWWLLAACSAPEMACTDIGSPSGIAVTVDRSIAAAVSAVTLRVCWDDTCTSKKVELSPGSDTVDGGCDGTDPDSTCTATAVPNGTLVGFADLAGLPEGSVSLAATVIVAGRSRSYEKITVGATATFPNGPLCGVGGNQAAVLVGASSLK